VRVEAAQKTLMKLSPEADESLPSIALDMPESRKTVWHKTRLYNVNNLLMRCYCTE
jgi:hypothetical protein